MTECEKVICKMYLEDMHDNCNENRLLLQMLEAEPCEDAISRQAVDEAIYDYSRSCDVNYAQIMKYIDKIPSVNPQPKTGHWIDRFGGYECSECGCLKDEHSNYCPDCGFRMVEPQESEV